MGKCVCLGAVHEEVLPCRSEDPCQGEGDCSVADWFHANVTEGHGFTPLLTLCMFLPIVDLKAAVKS